MALSTPQYALPGHVCPFAVRVPRGFALSGFSREYDYPHSRPPPEGAPYYQVRLGARTYLRPSTPTPFNAQFRLRAAVPLLRHRVAPRGSHGMSTVSAIALAVRLRLRARLTPG